jgi:hypothetical protein
MGSMKAERFRRSRAIASGNLERLDDKFAPVKVPFSCPNSSLSSKSLESPTQLMATNGCSFL